MMHLIPHAVSRRRRILVVDDVEINRDLVSFVLSAADYDVDVECDGEAGYKAASNISYDLVLMDLEMPGLTGFEAAARIRAHEGARSGVTIAALTATSLPGAEELSMRSGMDAFITHPIPPIALIDRISELLGDRRRSSEETIWAVWRTRIFGDFEKRLGSAKMGQYLGSLAERFTNIETMAFDPAEMQTELASEIHNLASVAGFLGFEELSQICRSIQEGLHLGCKRGRIPNLLGAIRRARHAIENYCQVTLQKEQIN